VNRRKPGLSIEVEWTGRARPPQPAATGQEAMDEVLLRVRPAAGGWKVESTDGVEPMMFLSGARAERSARALAQTIARAGKGVRLVIEDRSAQVVGAMSFAAA